MPSGCHFNITGSNIVKKCQQVSRSQNLLQHTWLALQLSENSCFHWSWKKEIFIIWNKNSVPEQTSFKMLVLLASSETRGLKINGQGLALVSTAARGYRSGMRMLSLLQSWCEDERLTNRRLDAWVGFAIGNDFNKMNVTSLWCTYDDDYDVWPKAHIAAVHIGDGSACWACQSTGCFACSPLTLPHPALLQTLLYLWRT